MTFNFQVDNIGFSAAIGTFRSIRKGEQPFGGISSDHAIYFMLNKISTM